MSRSRDSERERRGVNELVGGNAGQRAAGDVADHVAAGALGREADGVERVDNFRQRLDGEPVELDVLADGDVGQVAGVFAREAADDAKLAGGNDAVGNADAHHEVLGGEALAALAAGGADAVALGIDAPPLEVDARPTPASTLERPSRANCANLVEGLPRGSFRASGVRRAGPQSLFSQRVGSFFPFRQKQKARGSYGCIAGIWKPWILSVFRPRSPVRAKRHTAATTGIPTIHP